MNLYKNQIIVTTDGDILRPDGNGDVNVYIASEVDANIAALEKRIAVAINWINKHLRDKYPITLIDILTMTDVELNEFLN